MEGKRVPQNINCPHSLHFIIGILRGGDVSSTVNILTTTHVYVVIHSPCSQPIVYLNIPKVRLTKAIILNSTHWRMEELILVSIIEDVAIFYERFM